jgi:hypothetical protein
VRLNFKSLTLWIALIGSYYAIGVLFPSLSKFLAYVLALLISILVVIARNALFGAREPHTRNSRTVQR